MGLYRRPPAMKIHNLGILLRDKKWHGTGLMQEETGTPIQSHGRVRLNFLQRQI
jgi:hypothetical protein